MAAYVPTVASRIVESHDDLLSFKSQLEHIRHRIRRMEGRPQPDAERLKAQERRLADEYNAAQERCEVAVDEGLQSVPVRNGLQATAEQIFGPNSRMQVHESRLIYDAEETASFGVPPSRARGLGTILMAPILVCFGTL